MTLNLCSNCKRDFAFNNELCRTCSIFSEIDSICGGWENQFPTEIVDINWIPDPNNSIYWLFVRDMDIGDDFGWGIDK